MNVQDFNDNVMNSLFRDIYPVIAQQALAITGVCSGFCIDLGGGPGMLGISVALHSGLHVAIVDPLEECLVLAEGNITRHALSGRVTTRKGAAEALPISDGEADLVVSRGSIYFWESQGKGLREVYRVLKPGGWAYIGGGFGNRALREKIFAEKAKDDKWISGVTERGRNNAPDDFRALLSDVDIAGEVRSDESGTWIVFQKSGDPDPA